MKAKRTRAQIGRLSRTKGSSFERKVATDLRVYFPDARRQPQSQIKQLKAIAKNDPVLAASLCLSDVVAGPFGIECKHRRVLPDIMDTLHQAIEDIGDSGKIPVAVHKPSPGTIYDIEVLVYYPGQGDGLLRMNWIEFLNRCSKYVKLLAEAKGKQPPPPLFAD